MKRSAPTSNDKPEVKKSSLNDLLNQSKPKRDELPAEEFISPDPSRSVPDKNVGLKKQDKMGISQKAKNQPSDERDASERKK